MTYDLIEASALDIPLADESVQCVVTSPPYWGLRSYEGEQRNVWGGRADHAHEWGEVGPAHHPGQVPDSKHQHHEAAAGGQTAGSGQYCLCGAWYGSLGLEPTPEQYISNMVDVFREVRRVLRPDGTLWLNMGDSYTSGGRDYRDPGKSTMNGGGRIAGLTEKGTRAPTPIGLKPKDMVGIPWRVALALQADGWWLRSDIIWHKPNPMPSSVKDRPTKAHEYMFLLTKSVRYFYDADAIREPSVSGHRSGNGYARPEQLSRGGRGQVDGWEDTPYRNARTVWTIPTQPYKGAHFATFPEKLVEPCIMAGSAVGDTVLDPFTGSGTTVAVAHHRGRHGIGVDLSAEYLKLAQARIDQPPRLDR